jgi:NAD(P)-dependent dehydrogenase (short-subunit alcohol dehydrogenase family)
MSMILKDKIAIITGAGSGIGAAAAAIMAREGAFVVVSDRSLARAQTVSDDILSKGGKAEAVAADVASDGDLRALIEGTRDRYGRIDILHNHAGIQVAGPLTEVSFDGMDDSWRINIRAQFMACRLAVPAMIAQGSGVILNTSSSSGILVDREMIAYTTSKHALVAMTRQMALDYAKHNIRINAICPGWVDTPFNDPFIAQMGGRSAIETYVAKTVPMGRWASVDEMAEAILFCVSDRSSFMTGHALVIDGGESIP